MDKWQTITLREAGVILIDCDHRTPPAAISGYPYVTIPQLKNGRIDLAGVRYISNEHFKEWTKKANPEPYDVVLSRRCNPGETAFVPPSLKFALGQNLVLLRAFGNKVIPEYLRWLTRGDDWWEQVSKFINVGAVFDSLRCADIPNFKLPIPPIQEQHSIANLLQSLDNKIELNQRMNNTLEGIAQALFKSWFVAFDPIKAKAEGRKLEGMDDATAALFPSDFTDSTLEHIPEGWTAETLERVSFLNSESWSRNNIPDQIEYVDLANTKWGTIESTQIFSWKDAPSRAQRILRKGDTIVGIVRPGNGSYSFISLDGLTGSTGFAVLRPKETFYREFVYLSATSTENIARLTHLADGAAYPAVRPDVVYATPILFPGDEILLRFSQCLSPIMEKVEINKKENKILGDIRDLLLPRLISGKLRVDEISETMEALAV